MKLSIVTTLYCSAPYVEEFHRRATAAARKMVGDDYEIIMVNDGSPDNALDLAVGVTEHDSHLVVVDLSRNFGHHKAMMTGLAHAAGEVVFLIDSDLEESPEWLLDFAAQMTREHCDVVYGVQEHRKGKIFERWSGEIFYRFFRWITGIPFPKNVVTARLMSRRYIEALLQHKEREIFIAGMWYITGFIQKPITIVKLSTSPSTYTLRMKLAQALNAVTSFSAGPLILIFYCGLSISVLSTIYILYLLVKKFFIGSVLGGWTSLVVSIWFTSGIIVFFLGIIGLYLYKIFYEVKQRPYTIIREIYHKKIK